MGYHKYTSHTLSILLAVAASSASAQDIETDPDNPAGAPEICTSKSQTYATTAGCELYVPTFPLWSDGSEKQRYIFLPAGTAIDKSDPDHWAFPKGTRLYKNFMEADGTTLLETRVITKVGDAPSFASWNFKSYRWYGNEVKPEPVLDFTGDSGDAKLDATSEHQSFGALPHSIPSTNDCIDCHTTGSDPVLGYQAIQLGAAIPGIDDWEVNAVGYLHGNCGNCHSTGGIAAGRTELRMRASLSAAQQPVKDAIGRCYPRDRAINRRADEANELGEGMYPQRLVTKAAIVPGSPEQSLIYARMSTRTGNQMPPIASTKRHPYGMETVRAWIASLPATPENSCAPAPTQEPFEEDPFGTGGH